MTSPHTNTSARACYQLPQQDDKLERIIALYIFIFLLPIEMSLRVGGLFLTPTRLFFLVLAVPLIFALFKRGGVNLVDFLVFSYVTWVAFAYLSKRGAYGIEPAGQAFLEAVVPYLLARLFLKTPSQVGHLFKVFGIIIILLGLLAIPESILHVRYLHEIPRSLTGIVYDMQSDTRLGLLRAASTFENPILFGLFSASFLSLVWYASKTNFSRIALCLCIITTTFLSLSSAAILLILLQIFLIVLEKITRRIPSRTSIALGVCAVCVVLIENFSNRGVVKLIAGELTLNPYTGYYRVLQWEYSIDDVMLHPFVGINFENWTKPHWMTDSIDNHWLFLAMQSGLPAVFLLAAIILVVARRLHANIRGVGDTKIRWLNTGWILGMSALVLGGLTVTLFGKMLPSLFFFIGVGAALMEMVDMSSAQKNEDINSASDNRERRFSRFAHRHERTTSRISTRQ